MSIESHEKFNAKEMKSFGSDPDNEQDRQVWLETDPSAKTPSETHPDNLLIEYDDDGFPKNINPGIE